MKKKEEYLELRNGYTKSIFFFNKNIAVQLYNFVGTLTQKVDESIELDCGTYSCTFLYETNPFMKYDDMIELFSIQTQFRSIPPITVHANWQKFILQLMT